MTKSVLKALEALDEGLTAAFAKQNILLNEFSFHEMDYNDQKKYCKLNADIESMSNDYFLLSKMAPKPAGLRAFNIMLTLGNKDALSLLINHQESIPDDQLMALYDKKPETELDAEACYFSALTELIGYMKPVNAYNGLVFLIHSVEHGYPDALCLLAHIHSSRGHLEQAFELYNQANDKGNDSAAFWLGYMYDRGFVVEINSNIAFDYFYTAGSFKRALTEVGYALEHSDSQQLSVPEKYQDTNKWAKRFYNFAALQHEEGAEYNLGIMHEEDGNLLKAKNYIKRAADQKHPQALIELPRIEELISRRSQAPRSPSPLVANSILRNQSRYNDISSSVDYNNSNSCSK